MPKDELNTTDEIQLNYSEMSRLADENAKNLPGAVTAKTTERVRFLGWLAILLCAISAAHFLAEKAGGSSMDLQDTLFAVGLGYWVGWESHD